VRNSKSPVSANKDTIQRTVLVTNVLHTRGLDDASCEVMGNRALWNYLKVKSEQNTINKPYVFEKFAVSFLHSRYDLKSVKPGHFHCHFLRSENMILFKYWFLSNLCKNVLPPFDSEDREGVSCVSEIHPDLICSKIKNCKYSLSQTTHIVLFETDALFFCKISGYHFRSYTPYRFIIITKNESD